MTESLKSQLPKRLQEIEEARTRWLAAGKTISVKSSTITFPKTTESFANFVLEYYREPEKKLFRFDEYGPNGETGMGACFSPLGFPIRVSIFKDGQYVENESYDEETGILQRKKMTKENYKKVEIFDRAGKLTRRFVKDRDYETSEIFNEQTGTIKFKIVNKGSSGISEYYDEEGNLTERRKYENGERVKSS